MVDPSRPGDSPEGQPGAQPQELAEAVERERARILACLHDGPLQALERLAGGSARPIGCAECAEMRRIAGLAASELRDFIEAPSGASAAEPLHQGVGLVVARARWVADHTIELVRGPTDGSVSGPPLEALLGALREALANVCKHAGAARAVVYCEESGGAALVEVRDDGVGATPDQLRRGFGIRNSVVGRMEAAGGWARVEPAPAGGLVVTLGLGSTGPAR